MRDKLSLPTWTLSEIEAAGDPALLVLTVQPGMRGGYVPFEQPNPTPCCADHPAVDNVVHERQGSTDTFRA